MMACVSIKIHSFLYISAFMFIGHLDSILLKYLTSTLASDGSIEHFFTFKKKRPDPWMKDLYRDFLFKESSTRDREKPKQSVRLAKLDLYP